MADAGTIREIITEEFDAFHPDQCITRMVERIMAHVKEGPISCSHERWALTVRCAEMTCPNYIGKLTETPS